MQLPDESSAASGLPSYLLALGSIQVHQEWWKKTVMLPPGHPQLVFGAPLPDPGPHYKISCRPMMDLGLPQERSTATGPYQ